MKKAVGLLAVIFVLTNSMFAQANSVSSINELKSRIVIENVEDNSPNLMPVTSNEKKSTALAIMYSLLLPGMGELYAGDYTIGKYLTAADGVFWGVLIGFETYGQRQEDNYKAFAQSNGGVTLDGKDEDFFARVGSYMSVDEYNTVQELNREYSKSYNVDTHYWGWESNDKRKEYRNLWTSSEQAYNNVRFAVGALILNRIVSVINAVRVVNKHNKNLSQELGWNLNFGVENNPTLPSTLKVNFSTQF